MCAGRCLAGSQQGQGLERHGFAKPAWPTRNEACRKPYGCGLRPAALSPKWPATGRTSPDFRERRFTGVMCFERSTAHHVLQGTPPDGLAGLPTPLIYSCGRSGSLRTSLRSCAASSRVLPFSILSTRSGSVAARSRSPFAYCEAVVAWKAHGFDAPDETAFACARLTNPRRM